jgi:hypothetical protein
LKPNFADSARNEVGVEVARRRLRESLGQHEALEAIREIVANLLGSEEMGIFEVDRGERALPLLWSFGIDPQKHARLDASSDAVVSRVIEGIPHIEDVGGSTPFSVLLPIRSKGQTVAILAVLRLLPQKSGLDESDLLLLRLLSDEAGKALFE